MTLDWINEKIPRLPRGNWMYNLVCFFIGRRKEKLSYKEYMMISYELNKKALGDKKAKERAINKAMEIYKWHNGKLPEMGEE